MALFGWLSRKDKDPRAALTEVLGSYTLPTFPAIVLRALALIRTPDSSLPEIARALSADPGVTAKLLSVTNSAAFALRHPVKNVEHACSLLGRTDLESLLLGMAVRKALPTAEAPGHDPTRFWQAAARRATLARALAGLVDRAHRGDSFTASLLQDMAVPLIAQVHSGRYGEVLERWHAGRAELAPAEEAAFGWTHAHVAGWLCEHWKFPQLLRDAIGAHHDGEAEPLPGVALVSGLRETDGPEALPRLAEAALARHPGLSRTELEEHLGRAFEEAAEVATQLAR